ncbi:MAG TPA: sigma-70 family RNA polymerase sigma factor [Thermoleophilaceae bacterium]|nr:sigma-70 family RNA polymerase sigma factor [Thermoleophilaceae bacterium]
MPMARAMVLSDVELVAALRRGDETVFTELVAAYSPGLLTMPRLYVRDRAVAEEVVQEAWLGVLHGIDRFEGRSTLKTWIFRILINTAKTRAQREARTIPFSAAARGDEPSVDPDRFLPPDHRYPGGWMLGPSDWRVPEAQLMEGETRDAILRAIKQLPAIQKAVITMRDLEGLPAEEVAEALGISDGNQRVLLHRARSRIRGAIEEHLGAIELNTFAVNAS